MQISEEIPATFGIIFDGWSCNGEHYIALFATWTNTSGGVVHRLLACGVQDTPTDDLSAQDFGFSADDIGDYLYDTLEQYKRDFEAIEFLCGDNASVNSALANKIEHWVMEKKGIRRCIPLIGCASHRLNIAVQSLYCEGTIYFSTVEKVHTLMVALGTLKNRVKLAAKTNLSPIKQNETRWGSVFQMLKRYLELHPILPTCSFDKVTKDKFLTTREHYLVNELVEILYKCERTSVFLQKQDAHVVNLHSVRVAFDKLIVEIPDLESYIGLKARIVQSPAFEEAIVKLQKGQTLNTAEKKLVSIFKVVPKESDAEETEKLSFEDELLRDVERSKSLGTATEYRPTYHVSPTSNIVERLFSITGIIMRPHRRQMDPWSLELLIMLRANKDMWSYGTLQKIIDARKKENRDAAIARSNASAASKRQREDDQELAPSDGEV